MNKNFNKKLFTTLISRICHDLASPLGSLQMGLELMEENSASDAIMLCQRSAQSATSQLKFFRSLYGCNANQSIHYEQGVEALRSVLDMQKWAIESKITMPISGEITQIMLSLALGLVGLAPRGGALSFAGDDRITEVSLQAPVILETQCLEIFRHNSVEEFELTSKTVPFFWAWFVAHDLGYEVRYHSNNNIVKLSLITQSSKF
jgi:hypothetical protein